jgi:hypothetical protein
LLMWTFFAQNGSTWISLNRSKPFLVSAGLQAAFLKLFSHFKTNRL